MEIVNQQALSTCIRDVLREELKQHFRTPSSSGQELEERLLSKKELADELGVSLATLSDWMKKGLPFLRLHRRVYFRKSEVLKIMNQEITHEI
ncbi:putative DNA-binding transcriptional regulator AlpA [Pedobacter sp. UYEF25]